MRVIIAPDSFKGHLSSPAVAEAMKQGVLAVFPFAEVITIPIADGGEWTVTALTVATNGTTYEEQVTGPLGTPVQAIWGVLGDGETAVIEMAAASGLPLIKQNKRNPLVASTHGTGELVLRVLDKGIKKLILGIGGSATNDGGTGFATALGVRFLDDTGTPLPQGGGALDRLHTIDTSGLDARLQDLHITVACDVDTPLYGPLGASHIFGPQKGATPEMVNHLDTALMHYAEIAMAHTGKDIAQTAGTGAAGGLGAGLLYFTNATLRPGIEIVLEATKFEQAVADASLVITGEGNTDAQTAHGKAPVGIAAVAQKYGVPVLCLSGGLSAGYEAVYAKGISAAVSCTPKPMALAECLAGGSEAIINATERACRTIAIGLCIKNT